VRRRVGSWSALGDVIHFEEAFTWPPRDLTNPTEVVAVCESVDVERKTITYRSVIPCRHVWPLQPCEASQ
jgi:hypothetical protein